ncbi:MAG: ubiquitin-like protein, partial [Candidatus Fonsibacter sp.]
LSGKTITRSNVTTKTTIIDIKNMLEAKDGLPVRFQRLNFQGKNLKNGHTSGHYNIDKENTLHLVGRLCGGGKRPAPGTNRASTTRLKGKEDMSNPFQVQDREDFQG